MAHGRTLVSALLLAALAPGLADAAPKAAVLYPFADGQTPSFYPLLGQDGSVYASVGLPPLNASYAIFRLSPPAGAGSWTATTLATLPVSTSPIGGLVQDAQGDLFGSVAYYFTGESAVYELKPPVPGRSAWALSWIYRTHDSGVTVDLTGPGNTLFGRASAPLNAPRAGEVYALQQADPTAAWTYRSLSGRQAGVTFMPLSFRGDGPSGQPDLYGFRDDERSEHFFRLRAPVTGDGAWSTTDLYTFAANDPAGYDVKDAIKDRSLNVFGLTSTGGAFNFGTIFRLAPPNSGDGPWHESILHAMTAADGQEGINSPNNTVGLVENERGVLYAASVNERLNQGFIYTLTPASYGGNVTPWHLLDVYKFDGSGSVPELGVGSRLLPVRDNAGVLQRLLGFGYASALNHLGHLSLFAFTP